MTTAAQNSKQILAQKGTAATPSFSFLSGNTSGMYSAGTNQLGFSTAGVNAVTIDASQNVTVTGSFITPMVVGGTTASSSLTLKSTSGVGTTDSILFKVGNNGATTAMTVDTNGNMATGGNLTIAGALVPSSSFKRNRIINGNMLIDQRNAGASVTVNATAQFFPVDRWYAVGQPTDGVFTVQQVSDAPSGSGLTKSVKATITTADASIGATQEYFLDQRIEGYNVADFEFGAATAKTITVSFYVKSSVTGSFGGRIGNAGSTRTYPFSFTILSANTWEQKTVTITGDITGTWLTDNGIGMDIVFSLGVGSSRKGTANTWAATNYIAPTGSVDLISTSSATFYITGVQLEVGTVATPYEMQIYSDQLAQCRRYYEKSYNSGISPGTDITAAINGQAWFIPSNSDVTGAAYSGTVPFQVAKRTSPTGQYWDLAGNASKISNDAANNNKTVNSGSPFTSLGEWAYIYDFSVTSATNARAYWCWAVSAEL
jgi:hypothetical protein